MDVASGSVAGGRVSLPTVTPILVADLLAESERMPVYVHVIVQPVRAVLEALRPERPR